MHFKTSTCSLILAIFTCFFTAVSTNKVKTFSSSSPSSSFDSRGSISSSGVKGHRFHSGSHMHPNVFYRKTVNSPHHNAKWMSVGRDIDKITIIIPIITRYLRIHRYVQPTQYYNIIPSHIFPTIQIAERFRDNAIFILGFLLQSPNSGLTLQQYISLKIIYTALQRKEVQMYRMLPALIKLHGQSKTAQLEGLMFELSKYLPQYYSCSAAFWVALIHNKLFNPDAVLINGHEEFDLFTSITAGDIRVVEKYNVTDELSGYDQHSKITEMLLGRVFVKIFRSISVNQLNISQQLFAIILWNLPNFDGDVVYEEYVQFVAEIAWRNGIPNWELIQSNLYSMEIYTLFVTLTERVISNVHVAHIIKQPLIYIKHHFVNQHNYVMSHESYRITGTGGLDVTYLLSIISYGEFSYTAVQLKYALLEYSRTHTKVMESVLKGMNKYGYTSIQQLLLAFLIRLRTRLPVEDVEIRKTVFGLLSIVQLKIHAWHVRPTSSGLNVKTPNYSQDENRTINPGPEDTTFLDYKTTPRLEDATFLQRHTTVSGLEDATFLDHHKTTSGLDDTTFPGYYTTTLENKETSELDHGDQLTTTPGNKGITSELDHGDYHTTIPELEGTTRELDHGDYHTTTPENKGTTFELDHGDYHTTTPEIEGITSELDHGDNHTTTPELEGTTRELDHGDYHTTTPENKGTTFELDHGDYHTTTPEIEGITSELDHGDNHTTTPEVVGTTSELDHGDHHTTTPENKGTPSVLDHGDYHTTTPENKGITYELDHGEYHTTSPEIEGTTSELDHGDYHTTTPENKGITSELDHGDYHTTSPELEGTTSELYHGAYHTTTPENKGIASELDHGEHHTTSPELEGTTSGLDHGAYHTTTPENKGITYELDHGEYHTTSPEIEGTTSELDHGDYHTTTPENKGITSELHHGDYHTTSPELEGTTSELYHGAYHTTTPENKGLASELDHGEHQTTSPELEGTTSELDHGDHHTTTPENKGTPSVLDHGDYHTTTPENKGITSELDHGDYHTTSPELEGTTSELYHGAYHTTTPENKGIASELDHGEHHTTSPELEGTTSGLDHGAYHTTTPENKGITSEQDHGDYHTTSPKLEGTTSELYHGAYHTTTPENKGIASELDHGEHHTTSPELEGTTSGLDHGAYHTTTPENKGITYELDHGEYHTTSPEIEGTTSELDHGDYHTTTPENMGITSELDHGDYHTTSPELEGTTSELYHGAYHTTTPENKGIASELDHGEHQTTSPELEGTTSGLDHGAYYTTTPENKGIASELDHGEHHTTSPELEGTTSGLDHGAYHTSTPENEGTSELDHGEYHTTSPEVEGTTSELDHGAYHTNTPENEGTSELNRGDYYTTTAETKQTISELDHGDHHITTSGNVVLTPQQDQGDLYTTTPENKETTSQFDDRSHYTPTPQNEGTTSELDKSTTSTLEDHQITTSGYEGIKPIPQVIPELPADINPTREIQIELTKTGVPIFEFNLKTNHSKNVITSTLEDYQITTSGYEGIKPIPQVIPELPADINPTREIQIELTKTGVPIFEFNLKTNHSKNVITVPSVTCLQKSPSSGDSQNKCDSVTEDYITTHLINILGEDYIQQVLGDKWNEIYTTKISFLLALLKKSANNPKIQSHQKLMTIINKYQIALKSVATYVFLPLIVQQRKIDTKIVWSTFDYSNPSKTYIESDKPEEIGTNTITLPLVNPIQWLSPVDVRKPFDGILPDFPPDDPDAHVLQPLINIFRSNEITNLLGDNWNPSVYPNRGALFICVLRILLTRETVKTNRELYTLIRNYLRAIELPSVYVHIPKTYITTTAHQYHFVAIVPQFPVPISDIKTVIPTTLNPENKIQIVVSDLGVPSMDSLITVNEQLPLENLVSLPSVTCLQQSPSASNSHDQCEKDVDTRVTQILIQTFGENYIQMILGDNAKDRYQTRVSLLIALLEKLETHEKIVNQVESVKIIRKYRIALKSVASYILLPLVINFKNINSLLVWMSYNINEPSQANIVATPSLTFNDNIIILPLINPKTWVLTVDLMEPFSGLIPKFVDAESSFALQIQPLTQLIQTREIYKLLGSNWKVSQFPNRGALYISVLYKLLTVEQVKTNTKLYTLVKHYLKAIELSSINAHISNDYLKIVIHQWQVEYEKIITHFDPIVANVTARDDILLSALIDPNKNLRVTWKSSDRMFVESSRALEELPINSLTLPSVNCLQGLPDEEDDKYCEHFPDVPIIKSLIETLGETDAKDLLNENWNDEYPTMAAFLEKFCEKVVKNERVMKNEKLAADIERYRVAIEFASAYIFLPLLANYQEIEAELIWLTYDNSDYIQSHMSLHRADEDENIITLPLVNPKIWLQSVNVEHPFSSFLPNLPSNDPMATQIRPLTNLFNSGEIFLLLGKNWTPANYPSRGALFLSALRTLLNSTTVQSNKELHTLVQNYFNVIQVVSLYVHIPRSWINNEFRKAEYTWNVDVADLSTALPFPQSDEERSYFYYLQSFLHTENLLQVLDIQLPVISTYKADFLIMIIKRALVSTTLIGLSAELRVALEYYSAKAELALVARGGVVHWVWVRRMKGAIKSKQTLRLDIGKIFTTTLPLSRLNSKVAKVHYFKLIKFMNGNPGFLKTDDFKYARYPNYGQFLRAYLNHLMRRSNIDRNAKKYIKTVVEFIRNTGPGAIPIITSAAKKKLQ